MLLQRGSHAGLRALPLLQQLNRPLVLRAALLFAVRNVYVRIRCGRRRGRVSDTQRRHAVDELMRLAPAPEPRLLGGERIDTHTYCRFLSVNNWDPVKASTMIKKDFRWRMRYQPRMLRPSDMPTMCRQRAWMVLTKPVRAPLWGVGAVDGGGSGGAEPRQQEWEERGHGRGAAESATEWVVAKHAAGARARFAGGGLEGAADKLGRRRDRIVAADGGNGRAQCGAGVGPVDRRRERGEQRVSQLRWQQPLGAESNQRLDDGLHQRGDGGGGGVAEVETNSRVDGVVKDESTHPDVPRMVVVLVE